MADLSASAPCCGTDTQVSCCEPEEKSACCAPSADAGESCGCTTGEPDDDRDIREAVRARYAAAARAAAAGAAAPSSCCGPADVLVTDAGGKQVFGDVNYDADDVAASGGVLTASLGCGVPTAVADLHEGETVLDLGSGAGFPGMVLAIMAAGEPHSRLRVTLIESDTRKAAFLREVARTLGIAVDIIPARIESDQIRAIVDRIDCVTSRALAPLPRLLELSSPFFASGTVGLFLKGRDVTSEIRDAERDWSFALSLQPSRTEADARIAVVTDLKIRKGS